MWGPAMTDPRTGAAAAAPPYRLDAHPADRAPAPVVGERWDRPGPRRLPWHAHRRGQLIYAERGAVSVQAEGALFTVPPERAVWVPPSVCHAVRYPGPVAFRGVMIAPERCGGLPTRVGVVPVDPLMRELVRAMCALGWDYAGDGPEARLAGVLMDRLTLLRTSPLRLPAMRDERLPPIADALEADPSDRRGVAAWAALVSMTPRTLLRRVRADTGLPLSRWREQLLLARALERLAAGEAVTTVALDSGYRSVGGFGTAFKRAFGVPPSAYFERG